MHKKEAKIIKVVTITPVNMMTISCKILAMFTLSMGILVLECALLKNGWMSTHMTLVTGRLIVVVKIEKIKGKTHPALVA